MSVMIERLEGMVNRYHEINEMMMSPKIVSDPKMLQKLGRNRRILRMWWKLMKSIKVRAAAGRSKSIIKK